MLGREESSLGCSRATKKRERWLKKRGELKEKAKQGVWGDDEGTGSNLNDERKKKETVLILYSRTCSVFILWLKIAAPVLVWALRMTLRFRAPKVVQLSRTH